MYEHSLCTQLQLRVHRTDGEEGCLGGLPQGPCHHYLGKISIKHSWPRKELQEEYVERLFTQKFITPLPSWGSHQKVFPRAASGLYLPSFWCGE